MELLFGSFAVFSIVFSQFANGAWPTDDKIASLPNLPYPIDFANYAGYLDGGNIMDLGMENATQRIFYWLVEYNAQASNNSTMDNASIPLIFWFNGGPGCSSLGGLFTENGPFRVNQDDRTLYENVFSWNKAG